MSVFGVILVSIFPHSDWIRRDTPYLSVFCPNVEKYGPEQLRIRSLFTQWMFTIKIYHSSFMYLQAHCSTSHSDVWQCLFCFLIGCIQQFYWLTIVLNNFFRFEVELFSTPKKKKKSSTRKRNYCVLSGCACAKLRKNFSSGPWGLYGYKNLYPRLLHKEYFVCCEE